MVGIEADRNGGWIVKDRHGVFDTCLEERIPESPKSLGVANRERREAILITGSCVRVMKHEVLLDLVVSG